MRTGDTEPLYQTTPPYQGYFALALIALSPYVLYQFGFFENFPCPEVIIGATVGWGFLYVGTLVALMRRVEVYPDILLVKGYGGDREIDYGDIQWLLEIRNNRGGRAPAILMKYFDPARLQHRYLLCVPKEKAGVQPSMADYMRGQITRRNPGYSRDNEPSQWIPTIIGLAGVVVFFLAIRFGCPGFLF